MKDNNNIGISYKGILLNQHILQELPEDVLQWLEFYNSLSPDEQDTITYEPPELVCLSTPTNAGKTVIAAGSDVEELEIYDSSGFPFYIPEYWNERTRRANCYAYAMNVVVDGDNGHLRPGNVRGKDIKRENLDINGIAVLLRENLLEDGESGKLGEITHISKCTFSDIPNNNNQYRVALVLAHNNGVYVDYHWYREDTKGIWSHKRGTKANGISQSDSDGKEITKDNPPCVCARVYGHTNYSIFVDYFMITHT